MYIRASDYTAFMSSLAFHCPLTKPLVLLLSLWLCESPALLSFASGPNPLL